MTALDLMPSAVRPFLSFPTLLRRNGFAIAPEQTTAFLEAVTLLGPRTVRDIRLAGRALLAPPPERIATYDALFDAHFLGAAIDAVGPPGEADDAIRVQEERSGFDESDLSGEVNEAGEAATGAEVLTTRAFSQADASLPLLRLERELPRRIPLRRGYRVRSARTGPRIDLRRSLRRSIRSDGEVMALFALRRRPRARRVLVLIDVSGSMKERTDTHLRLAHALAQRLPTCEVFTFGTRLTRISRALKLKRREQALATAAGIVSDWDGGTRIGDALQAFLAVPRFAGYARGAIVIVISDGLERGDPAPMQDAVARFARRAWRISWLSPLAIGPGFRPETEALKAVAPLLHDIADASSLEAIVTHILGLSTPRRHHVAIREAHPEGFGGLNERQPTADRERRQP
jgi:hypothetical protein